ncbi:MAG: hypothetical protein V1743_06225 [Nanoarchaeota archaeon]
MKAIADTGAILSLSCSCFADVLFKEHDIHITKGVAAELQEFAQYDDFLGKKAQEALSRKLPLLQARQLLDLQIERAEQEVISIAKEEKCLCLTDDIRAARLAFEMYHVKTRPSFYLLLFLYKKKAITKKELIDDIRSILNHRNWLSGALWEYAVRLIEKLG